MVAITILILLSVIGAHLVNYYLDKGTSLNTFKHTLLFDLTYILILCLVLLQLCLNNYFHTYFIGKFSDLIYYLILLFLLDIFLLGREISGMYAYRNILMSVYRFLRYSSFVMGIVSAIFLMTSMYRPSDYLKGFKGFKLYESGEIAVFNKYWLVMSDEHYFKNQTQKDKTYNAYIYNDIDIYRKVFLLFKTQVAHIEIEEICNSFEFSSQLPTDAPEKVIRYYGTDTCFISTSYRPHYRDTMQLGAGILIVRNNKECCFSLLGSCAESKKLGCFTY